MILPQTYEIAGLFHKAGLRYWIFGGNGVELACGLDIRPHDDIDVFIALEDAPAAVGLLERSGFRWHAGSLESGDVFYERGGVLVDVVPIDDRSDPPRTLGKLSDIRLPSGLLTGLTLNRPDGPVVTLTPAMHLAMKAAVGTFYGTPPREKDRLDAEHLLPIIE